MDSSLQGLTAFDFTVDDSDNVGEDCDTVLASNLVLREAGRQVDGHGFPGVQVGVRSPSPTPVVEQNRFAVLSAEVVPSASRRLVLVRGPKRASMDVESQRDLEVAQDDGVQGSAEPAKERVGHERAEADTESLPSMDEVSGDEVANLRSPSATSAPCTILCARTLSITSCARWTGPFVHSLGDRRHFGLGNAS